MKTPTAHSLVSLERFLEHIRTAPVPDVVTRAYLKKSGFHSDNDPELRHILWLLGFLSDRSVPLERWNKYKEEGQPVLHEAVLEHYAGLLTLFPNAPQLENRQLEVWFQPPLTGNTWSAVNRSIRTFRKLCQLAGIIPDYRVVSTSVPSNFLGALRQRRSQSASDEKLLPVLNPPDDSKDHVRFLQAYKTVFLDE
jgi:hypothetical protein